MSPDDFTEASPGELVRNLDGDWSYLPGSLPGRVEWTNPLALAISNADRALGQLVGVGRGIANPKPFLSSVLRREAELSSRIEGTRAGLRTMVLFEHDPSIEENAPDVREVTNNYLALMHGLQSIEGRGVTLSLIREMHQILLRGVRGQDATPGAFRRIQAHIGTTNRIAEARFVPAPPHAIDGCMEQLQSYLHLRDDHPPLARIAMAHYQFEAIHPFADGNGRIGRVLILLMMRTEGILPLPLLNISSYLERHRREYYDHLLAVSQRGQWMAWIEFFARGVAQEAEHAVRRIEQLEALRERYNTRARGERASKLLPRLIDHLFEEPAVTVNSVGKLLGIGFPSARKLIDRLERTGILQEVTEKQRGRVFIAQEVLDVFEPGPYVSGRVSEPL